MPKYCARGQSCHQETPCVDVCTSPLCGTPDLLRCMQPLIYDEIGINVCRTITVTNTAFATQTTAEKATVQFWMSPSAILQLPPLPDAPTVQKSLCRI